MSLHPLRPYQEAMLTAVSEARARGLTRLLCKAPTGSGKSRCFAELPKWPAIASWIDSLPKQGARMLIVAHREELLEQARATLEAQNHGLMVSIEQGDRHANSHSDVIVASIQTLAARKFHRLKRLLARHAFRIVVVDEAHHAAASTYRTALAHLGFLPLQASADGGDMETPTHDDVEEMKQALAGWDAVAPKDRLLIGVTATPNRSDAIGLECVFQHLACSYGLKQAIDDGWLVPPVPWVIETDTSLDEVRTSHGDFNQKDLAEAVNNEHRNQIALAAWQEHACGLPTIGFTVDVQHAHDMADLFTRAGIAAKAISGETPKDERRQTLRDYTAGHVTVLFNCMVLTEGTDLPRTSCILHAKPTKSATLFEQMSGRGLRLFEGKTECVILDLVDVSRKHSLQTSPVLYGLPPGLKTNGVKLDDIANALDQLREKYPNFDVDSVLASGRYSLEELRARASTFDIWTVPSLGAMAETVTMNWIKSGEASYRLQYPWADGVEVLVVEKDLLGHFDISLTLRPTGNAGQVRQRTIASQIVTPEEALGMAEAFVLSERRSASRITDRSAAWRQDKPSKGQLGMLRALRVPTVPTSKGQASDLINLAKARTGR